MDHYGDLREDIREIKTSQQQIRDSLADLRVLVAGNYVSKAEFAEYKKDHIAHHRWLWGAVTSVIGLFISIIALALTTGG